MAKVVGYDSSVVRRFVCALLDRHSEVVLADVIKEEVGVIGTASLQVTNRRRIVIRKDSEETGYEERFI